MHTCIKNKPSPKNQMLAHREAGKCIVTQSQSGMGTGNYAYRSWSPKGRQPRRSAEKKTKTWGSLISPARRSKADRQNYSRHWKPRLRLCFGEGKGGRFQKISRVLAVFWFLPGDGQSLRHVNFKKEKKKGLGILDICTSCTQLYFIKIYKSCLKKIVRNLEEHKAYFKRVPWEATLTC